MNATRAALLSICVLAGAAGCSAGDDNGAAAPITAPSATAAGAVEAQTSTTTATPSPPTTTTTRPVAAPPSHRRVEGFQTPSGNIACVVTNAAGDVRCDIDHVNFAPPPKPASCQFDWGHALVIVAEEASAEFTCVSDTVLGPDQPKVPVGTSVVVGRSICEIDTRSIACTVSETDGGLFLSEDRYYTSFEEG